MAKLKIGRNIVEVDEADYLLDNGTCYQLVTRKVICRNGYSVTRSNPILSKKLFSELKKTGLIYSNNALRKSAELKYGMEGVSFWKFNIPLMERLGY